MTAGASTPSARFRVRQLIDALAGVGVYVTELVPDIDIYAPSPARRDGASAIGRWSSDLVWLLRKVRGRAGDLRAAAGFDGAWLCRETLPYIWGLDGLIAAPYVLDVDDAVWTRNPLSAAAFRRTAANARLVLAGNEYLAEHSARYADVVLVPTAVDTSHLHPPSDGRDGERFVVGWIGTASNLKYLEMVAGAIEAFLECHPDALLRIVSNGAPDPRRFRTAAVDFVPWSEEREVKLIQGFDVGLMPLTDDHWTRGKCGYKLLSYLACGVPGVASDVGPNRQILADGGAGVVVENEQQWREALETLYTEGGTRREMGRVGRQHVEENYSVPVIASAVASALRRAFPDD